MIKLTGNKIAVQAITDPDRSESGLIIIPDEAKERSDQGIVKYVGPDVKDIKLNDYILFSGYTGTTVQMPGDEGTLIIFKEEFVVAKLGEWPKGGFENLTVNGLYFREKWDREYVKGGIKTFIASIIDIDECAEKILEEFASNIPYFPATYEHAVQLMADAAKETPLAKSIALKDPKDKKGRDPAKPDIGWNELNPMTN